ncbi:MAG: YbaK/EbsC family protein [Ilumatobacteraceae bacterium]
MVPASDIERRVVEILDGLGQPYELFACDPALADTAAFCEAYGFSPADSANTIVALGKSDPPVHVACVVLATTRLDVNGTVRRRLGVRKASFAPADDTAAATGMQIGGVTPFALPPAMPVWIDGRVAQRERIVLGGGSRSIKVICPPTTLLALASAELVDDLALDPT